MCITFWGRSPIAIITFSKLSIQRKLRTNSLGETLIITFSWASSPFLTVVDKKVPEDSGCFAWDLIFLEGSPLLRVCFQDLKIQKCVFICFPEGYEEHMAKIWTNLESMMEKFPEKWRVSWDLEEGWASVGWTEWWWCDSRQSNQDVQKLYGGESVWSPKREERRMMGEKSREIGKNQIMWVTWRVLDFVLRAAWSH